LFDIKHILDFYKYMADFTKHVVLPIITFLSTDTPETKAYKALMKIIIFEIVHEKAWPMTFKSLCKTIILRYDEYPVENIDLVGDQIQTYHYLFADPSTLGNVVAKLRHGFYDDTNDINSKIVPLKFRTSEHVAKAAEMLLSALGCSKVPSHKYLLALTKDKHSLAEYDDIKPVNVENNPVGAVPYPVEPENEFNDSILYPTFRPVAGVNNIAKQLTLHTLKNIEGNTNWMEGYPKKGGRRQRSTRKNKLK
jgi:hypothetical protein